MNSITRAHRGGIRSTDAGFQEDPGWHEAQRLALNVHHCLDAKRFSRYPGKRSQTFRCADSIASNIAEGSAKDGREFARYLDMSLASATELESHLLFAGKANLIPESQYRRLMESVEHVRRMLIKFIRKVRQGLIDEGSSQ